VGSNPTRSTFLWSGAKSTPEDRSSDPSLIDTPRRGLVALRGPSPQRGPCVHAGGTSSLSAW